MKHETLIDSSFALGGFTSGKHGIWTRNEPADPPTEDYTALGEMLGIPLTRIVRPYQANGSKAAIVGAGHGGSGVIRGNDLTRTDALVTAQKGLVLSIIAADCAPVYLTEPEAGIIGLLHCGRQSADGDLIRNAVGLMKELGAAPGRIKMTIGPHICRSCYEVGEDVKSGFTAAFSSYELGEIFSAGEGRLFLDMGAAITIKAVREGILRENIISSGDCTCHGNGYYSYRRGDRGTQDLAYLMMKQT